MRARSQRPPAIQFLHDLLRRRLPALAAIPALLLSAPPIRAQDASVQTTTPPTTELKVEQLAAAVTQAQAQMENDQKQLLELRQQLSALQLQIAADKAASSPAVQAPGADSGNSTAAHESPAALDEIRERQAIEESQIATHEVTKVETDSKYPLKVTGLVLFNGFVNTRQVDTPAAPAYAIAGPGSTGLSLRQTVLGLDARGPHLFNATSRADLRVDFFANDVQSNYAAAGVLRLRTAHAALNWANTQAFVELDRSILNPNEPTSLVAVAQPDLAWAGNLWSWNPQVGASHRFSISDYSRIEVEAALIDTADPQVSVNPSGAVAATQTELSRWPGTEARIAWSQGENGIGPEIGAGGYFSPHRDSSGDRFDAWAGTMDLRLPLSRYFQITANAYRGQALAGLGGGGYVNYFYQYVDEYGVVRALDAVGGWSQLKAKATQRLEFNAGYGTDNSFSKEVEAAIWSSRVQLGSGALYAGLARNRSFYSNLIYSPSAYLLFSLEYKRLWTNYGVAPTAFSDVIGLGAGYRF